MRNGAYQALAVLGKHWGIGNILVTIYAITQCINQSATLQFVLMPFKSFWAVQIKTLFQTGYASVPNQECC